MLVDGVKSLEWNLFSLMDCFRRRIIVVRHQIGSHPDSEVSTKETRL